MALKKPVAHKHRAALAKGSFHRVVPNLTTIASLCAGMSAVRFALLDRWETAVALILVAGVLDALDGRLARMLGSVSRFGAQLDSFSDFMSFGVAPAFILFHFSLKHLGGLGWAVSLIFAVSMALRLARFNVQDEMPQPPSASKDRFFTGVPAPAAAVLALTPLMVGFDFQISWAQNPWMIAGLALMVSALMVSRIPTFAFKGLKVAHSQVVPVLILVVVMIAGLLSAPWPTILILCALYVLLIPVSWRQHRLLSRGGDLS